MDEFDKSKFCPYFSDYCRACGILDSTGRQDHDIDIVDCCMTETHVECYFYKRKAKESGNS